MDTLIAQNNSRLLVIDDNRAIHEDFRKILCTNRPEEDPLVAQEVALFGSLHSSFMPIGFELDSAYQGKEGLELAQTALESRRPYAIAFVDMRMPPGWDGLETIARLWPLDPELQVVICTAYSDYSFEQINLKLGNSDRLVILKKPFEPIELLQLANTLTEKWRLHRQAKLKLEQLETEVQERTRGLREANARLESEIAQRQQAQTERERSIAELKSALAKVQTLSGLIPICAGCKRVRDDKGYWTQVEVYVREHSTAEFTHSLCPACTRKYYPDIEYPASQ